MTITWTPVRGEGYWKNGILIGKGQYINDHESIMKKGTFDENGVLNSTDCEVINYSDTNNVSIRKGPFVNGKEHGEIFEYVFTKSDWEDFKTRANGINSTKYTQLFSNGVWQSTTATVNNKRIKGTAGKSKSNPRSTLDMVTSFSFEEQ